LNDGETAVIVPLRLKGLGMYMDYREAFIVWREGMPQTTFLEKFGVMDGAKEAMEELCNKLQITDIELKEAIKTRQNKETCQTLRKLVAYRKKP